MKTADQMIKNKRANRKAKLPFRVQGMRKARDEAERKRKLASGQEAATSTTVSPQPQSIPKAKPSYRYTPTTRKPKVTGKTAAKKVARKKATK